jgi:hypothetical protein
MGLHRITRLIIRATMLFLESFCNSKKVKIIPARLNTRVLAVKASNENPDGMQNSAPQKIRVIIGVASHSLGMNLPFSTRSLTIREKDQSSFRGKG